MRAPIRVGFLGSGNLNTIQHYPNIAASADAAFEAVCDLNEALMVERATPYAPRLMTTDYDTMLADPAIDIVWIAAEPPLQADLAGRALEAGKHTFVEKPMAETMAECVQLGRLAKAKGVGLFTGYNRRFAPAYVDLKSIMATMTEPPMITYRLVDDGRDRHGGFGARLAGEDPGRPQLLDEACHIFDIFAHLTEAEPVSVTCHSIPHNNDMVLLQYDNGAVANLTVSMRGTMAFPKERIEVIMDHAAATVEDFVELTTANVPGWGHMVKRYPGFEYPGWLSGYKHRMEWEGLGVVRHFRQKWQGLWNQQGLADMPLGPERDAKIEELIAPHMRSGTMPPVNYLVNKGWCAADHGILKGLREGTPIAAAGAVDAARSIACAEAAIASARTGQPVKLNPADWQI